jgi:hypothetical protein
MTSLVLSLALFYGTSLAATNQVSLAKSARPAMPPLPSAILRSAPNLPIKPLVATNRLKSITLAWECLPSDAAPYWLTGIDASSDLRSWTQVVAIPYAISNRVTLTNRPPLEFYRAKNWQR